MSECAQDPNSAEADAEPSKLEIPNVVVTAASALLTPKSDTGPTGEKFPASAVAKPKVIAAAWAG